MCHRTGKHTCTGSDGLVASVSVLFSLVTGDFLLYMFFRLCVFPQFLINTTFFSGTQGLAVTYCCHGEEENKMMAIAQKCGLSLSALPCESGPRRRSA